MSKWTNTILGGIAHIITGPFGSQLHQSDYISNGTPIVMPQNIVDRKIDYSQINCISESDAHRLIKYSTQENDILYARRGDVEKHAFITEEDSGVYCGTGCLRVRLFAQNVDPLFLSFFLNRKETRKWLISHAVGTNMLNLNTDILAAVPVRYPHICEQRKIATILNTIDKKTQINNRINDNLQQQLKLLYDYWFTQFDFPDENGKPYHSSGGAMVWNEQLKREIPISWRIINIKEISKITWGQCPDGKNILDRRIHREGLIDYCSGAGDMKGGFLVDCQAKTDNSKRFAHKNDILVSVAGKIGDICVVDHTISLGRAAMAYTAIDSKQLTFIYMTLQALNRKMTTISTGSIQKVINNDHIDSFIFPYDESVVSSFGMTTAKIFEELMAISHENKHLNALRDWILPMLMNGQATISD